MTTILPQVFKGIALFTPGGDLIYGIDPHKQTQWHVHLCQELKQTLNLASPPHFLVPGYTATIERWLDPQTNRLVTIAEAYPAVRRYIPLLQTIFQLEPTTQWHIAPWREESCNKNVIDTYRSDFPQLWARQNLIMRHELNHPSQLETEEHGSGSSPLNNPIASEATEGYKLRLFISSKNPNAEQALSHIHQLLEESLISPYTLKIIDIAKNPESAITDKITTTPTLIRVSPKPVRRIVGQLNDIPRILHIISSF
ncbi:MAG: circadian clock KaiB family protein [Cyanobacteria bacterium P01_A01_bin.83]